MSHPQCSAFAWRGKWCYGTASVIKELGGAGCSACARRCDWDNRPPEAYFGRADVPSAVQCVRLAREVVLWHGFGDQRAGWCWLKRLCPPLRLGQSPSRGVFWEGGCPIRSAVQCVGLAREVVLWHGFDNQSWVVLALAPLPAAAGVTSRAPTGAVLLKSPLPDARLPRFSKS